MKRLLCGAAAIVCAFLCPVSQGRAQSPAPGKAPPAEMAALYPRIGTWRVIMKLSPTPDLPKGGTDIGIAKIRKGPGGSSLVQDFTAHGTSGDQAGTSLTWWDPKTAAYRSVWCDNTQGCTEFTTQQTGLSWRVELDGGDGRHRTHTVIAANMSADHKTIVETVSTSDDGGPSKVLVTSTYSRTSAGVRP